MGYSELIKDFKRIREYMRQFYIYGFKTRDEYKAKSSRSYDNERRRMESWLGDCMSFRQDATGKTAFISVDSQDILHNPLYSAFKAKSFTANDISLHFYIMDILEGNEGMSVREIADAISAEYLVEFEAPRELDESTIRKKLKEYEKIGLIKSEKQGRKLVFSKVKDVVDLKEWEEAIAFFSELEPLGVLGSFLLDRMESSPDYITFKHHYILHALESEIMYQLLDCMSADKTASITMFSKRKAKMMHYEILPLKIMISTQNGRSYVFARSFQDDDFSMYRLDNIKSVKAGEIYEGKRMIVESGEHFLEHEWYVSCGSERNMEHVEMVIQISSKQRYILQRLEKEGQQGSISKVDEDIYKYSVDVYDASEMLPWIRTFTGRILSFSCSNKNMESRFYEDLKAMHELYGGGNDAV